MPYKSTEEQRTYQREWYLRNRDQRLARQKELREEYRAIVNAEKVRRGCAHCGYDTFPIPLDAHHPEDDKQFAIANGIGSRKALDVVMLELAKCEILCANCHRLEHHRLKEASG